MISVQLLSVPGCEACVTLRKSLDKLEREQPDLTVEEIDVSVRREVAVRYGLMACPAVVIDGSLEAVGAVGQRKLRKMVDRRREALASALPDRATLRAGSN